MEADTVATLFGIVLFALVVATVIAVFVAPWRALLVRGALPVTAFVAVGATAGSLYFSEVADFVPCELCWFQRIAMYPLSLILVLAILYRDRRVYRYVVPVAVIGFLISAYHVQVQLFPEESNFCAIDNPCTAKWVEAFGFLTIPQMAGTCFALIVAIGTMSLLADRRPVATADEPAADELVDA